MVKVCKPKYCSVKLSDVISRGCRIDASAFDVDAMQARDRVQHGRYKAVPLGNMLKDAYYGPRLKRQYVSGDRNDAVGFVGSSEMLDCYPRPAKFMVETDETKQLRVSEGTILVSRSGTIGNAVLTNKTLARCLVSEHSIRLECCPHSGYVYAYLRTSIGKAIVKSNTFGAVIQHIEPEHLKQVLIPDAPEDIKCRIDELVRASYRLRDESNELLDEAEALLVETLGLPLVKDLQQNLYKPDAGVDTFSVKLSDMAGRADASYHVPVVDAIVDCLGSAPCEVTTVGDERVSKDVMLPGRFKRVYVEDGYGTKFLGWKCVHQLDPSTDKYLSIVAHKKELDTVLGIKPNSLLLPARGSLGDVEFPSKQFYGWAISDNMMQLFSMDTVVGYLFVWLNSDYGRILTRRFIYGGVIDAIEPDHVMSVEVPLLDDKQVQKHINDLALAANAKRYDAYQLEQEALRIMNEEVLL